MGWMAVTGALLPECLLWGGAVAAAPEGAKSRKRYPSISCESTIAAALAPTETRRAIAWRRIAW
jgi:hypothetical protein